MLGRLAGITTLAALALTGGAQAATLELVEDEIGVGDGVTAPILLFHYTAGATEKNRLDVRLDGDRLVFGDPGARIALTPASRPACTTTGHTAGCATDGKWIFEVTAHLGDQGDTGGFRGGFPFDVYGEQGADVLRAPVGATYPHAVLDGGLGDDRLLGGDGYDWVAGGPGADDMSGGGGTDQADYRQTVPEVEGQAGVPALPVGALPGVTVTLDDRADDGLPRERDNVHSDVENVYGSRLADVVRGNGAANSVYGMDGDDVINGGGGDDNLSGQNGDDDITGGSGRDILDGDEGDDALFSRDGGEDALSCWAGTDTATVDAFDYAPLQPECESWLVG